MAKLAAKTKKGGRRRTASKKKAKSRKRSSAKAAAGRSSAKTGKRKTSAKKTALKRSTAKRSTSKRAAPKRSAAKRSGGVRAKSVSAAKATTRKRPAASAAAKTKKKKASAKRPSKRGAPNAQCTPAAGCESERHLECDPPLPKTHLTDKQLQEFRQLLLRKRAELAGDVRQLTREAFSQGGGASEERSTMPIHMADLGSDNWEQEFTLGLIASERNRVQEIDEALLRINNRTYGVCLATRKRITVARLRAKPWAAYCIDYARLRDEGRLP